MQKLPILTLKISFLSLILLFAGCATEFRPIEGVHVPKNLAEAYIELDHMLTAEEKEGIRSGDWTIPEFVLSYGLQLKEYWGLWRDSDMAKHMRKKHKIEHPDRMVTVILQSYREYLRNQKI